MLPKYCKTVEVAENYLYLTVFYFFLPIRNNYKKRERERERERKKERERERVRDNYKTKKHGWFIFMYIHYNE